MTGEYEIRDYRSEDEEAILDLIKLGMGDGQENWDKNFWRWKHYDNPFGESISLIAENEDGIIIGLRTFMRWRFQYGSESINAVRAVDTVTHPEYRRYGVFSRLTKAAVQRVREEGVDLIFNTPNNQVLPGYLKLGWHYVNLVRPMVKVLNYPKFFSGILRNLNKSRASVPISGNDVFRDLPSVAEFLSENRNALSSLIDLQKSQKTEHLKTDHFMDYLKWRYAEHPFIDYRVLFFSDGPDQSGCFILRPNTRFGLKEIMLNEFITSNNNINLSSTLITQLKRQSTADYVISYFARDSLQRRLLTRKGFFRVPIAGQNFTVNVLNDNLSVNPKEIDNWHLGLGDLEMF